MKDGFCDGKGLRIDPNVEVYYGNFKEGKKSGKGEEVKQDGRIYTGFFKNDVYEGEGQVVWPEDHKLVTGGGLFKGSYKNGKRSGKGKQWINGKLLYDGNWENDTRSDD